MKCGKIALGRIRQSWDSGSIAAPSRSDPVVFKKYFLPLRGRVHCANVASPFGGVGSMFEGSVCFPRPCLTPLSELSSSQINRIRYSQAVPSWLHREQDGRSSIIDARSAICLRSKRCLEAYLSSGVVALCTKRIHFESVSHVDQSLYRQDSQMVEPSFNHSSYRIITQRYRLDACSSSIQKC